MSFRVTELDFHPSSAMLLVISILCLDHFDDQGIAPISHAHMHTEVVSLGYARSDSQVRRGWPPGRNAD